jgi:hypothetical protein
VTLETDTRLRVGRAIGKDEASVALALMRQLKARGHPDQPPPLATDGQGDYREALVATWGAVPPKTGRQGRPATQLRPPAGCQYLQVIKERSGGRLLSVRTKVIYGEPEAVVATVGAQTAYAERTQLTSRQMNGRLVRKTLSFSKQVAALAAASAWEDGLYNLSRPVKTLRVAVNEAGRRWQPRSPAMAAGLTDHLWSVKELLTTLVLPHAINTQ